MTSDRSIEPLLGRAAELSRLGALLDEALSGQPCVVIISGEPGIGKTTLLRQFTDDAARRGARILWPRSFGSPGAPPYWLWRSALGPPDLLREVSSDPSPASPRSSAWARSCRTRFFLPARPSPACREGSLTPPIGTVEVQ